MPNSRLKPIDEVRRDVAHLKNTVKYMPHSIILKYPYSDIIFLWDFL